VNNDNLDISLAEQELLVSFAGVRVVKAFYLFLCFTGKFVLSYSDCPLSEISPCHFEKSKSSDLSKFNETRWVSLVEHLTSLPFLSGVHIA
jgi:hypothetical protein